MHTSNALSRLHNLMDTPDNKDIIPLHFLQHFTPNYIEHTYSHWVDNLYVHKAKDYDMTQVKRKCSRPPKQKTALDNTPKTAANTHTAQPRQVHKNSKSEIISRDLIDHINKEWEKSDRLTAARLDSIVKGNKKNYKSNLMTEKYSLSPSQSYPLTPVQTALQQLSEKQPDFEIEEIFEDDQMVYLLAPHSSALQMSTTKFRQDFIGPLFIDTTLDKTHYRLKDATGLLLDGTYHMNYIKKG